ncbi:MAG TPA: hypothetical protein PL091_16490 [Actinomycetota bacterium]|nr:hypothetical protein [Actinomycetota bacterium]HRY11454.1 hypothetical protein [Candidatus Nanopelagicales bacterium]
MLAVVSLLLLGGYSALLSLNAWASDAARWKAGEDLVAEAWSARDVDPGMEWVGWHAAERVNQPPLRIRQT